MQSEAMRRGLYLERVLVAFSAGIFLTLPLYFKAQGGGEIFFGQVYAAGAIGALFVVSMTAMLLGKFGLRKVAPLGSALFSLGALLYYFAAASEAPPAVYYIASLILGGGWGLLFTIGPICMSSTLDQGDHARLFTIYAACGMLGIGLAPIFAKYLMTHYAVSFASLFALSGVLSLIACFASVYVAWNNHEYAKAKPDARLSGRGEFKQIMKLPSIYFFAMVGCGACIYTAVITLQTTFAAALHIDYTIFFALYSVAVVAARFFLSKPLSKFKPADSLKWLMVLMIVALSLMYKAADSPIYYGVGAALFGISYGLLYPIIQAQAAIHAPASLRSQTLVYFSMASFAAMYLFPYLGAKIAVAYGYSMLIVALIVVALIELLLAAYFYRVPLRQAAILVEE